MIYFDANIKENKLNIKLPSSMTLYSFNFILIELKKTNTTFLKTLLELTFDFSNVDFIDPDGALCIICFCGAIKENKIPLLNSNIRINIIYPHDTVFSYLISLGFFGQMSNKVGFLGNQNIVEYENKLRHEKRNRQKPYSSLDSSNTVILPIETIEKAMGIIREEEAFESKLGTFINVAINSLNAIFNSYSYNFRGKDIHNFLSSNVELYKNVFEHSKSWGLAVIHARPKHGTTVCYYDIGIGFKASVNKFETDYESIDWALEDLHSGKNGAYNDGFGLTIVQDFVSSRNGTIKIRSGTCLMEKKSHSIRESYEVSWFPGAQISYFIPSLH